MEVCSLAYYIVPPVSSGARDVIIVKALDRMRDPITESDRDITYVSPAAPIVTTFVRILGHWTLYCTLYNFLKPGANWFNSIGQDIHVTELGSQLGNCNDPETQSAIPTSKITQSPLHIGLTRQHRIFLTNHSKTAILFIEIAALLP